MERGGGHNMKVNEYELTFINTCKDYDHSFENKVNSLSLIEGRKIPGWDRGRYSGARIGCPLKVERGRLVER